MIDKDRATALLEHHLGNGLKAKKTLLVTLDSPFLDSAHVFPYLGILYLLSVAQSAGLPIYYFQPDDNDGYPKMEGPCVGYTDLLPLNDPTGYAPFDIIGISCMTPQGAQAYSLCRQIKRLFPDKTVMIGGPHAKFYLDECLQQGFDIVVTGDGERIFEEMIAGDFQRLAGRVSTMTQNTLVVADSLSAAQMNRFPIPHREIAYLGHYHYLLECVPATTLVNSRGCPMHCAFCEHSGSSPRWYTAGHFEAELCDIVGLGYNGIMIFDDLFALNPRMLQPYLEILQSYHDRDGLLFRCFGHARIIAKHPELLKLLANAGCVEIGIGAESASQTILNAINKNTTAEQLHSCVNLAARLGIKVKAFFMIGLPGETEHTFASTHAFIKQYRKKYPAYFDFDLSVFFPYRGTMIGDAIRLEPGAIIQMGGRRLDRTSFDVRLNPNYAWAAIDSGDMGAYKKKGGESDLVIESYDWHNRKVLLSARQIKEFKDRTMTYSGRYASIAPGGGFHASLDRIMVSEGNIGHIAEPQIRRSA